MIYLIAFIFGSAIGSFLNVMALRYEIGQRLLLTSAIGGRSHCPSCGQILRWYELIPLVSFLVQRRRCRSCGVELSWQYPLVELASGAAAAATVFYFEGPVVYLSLLLLAGFALILMSAIDYRLYIIPNQLNLFIALLGIAAIAVKLRFGLFGAVAGSWLGNYALIFGLRDNIFLNHLAAALVGSVFLGLLYFFSRGRAIGMGDVKLAGALGLLVGWPDIVLLLIIAFIVGSVVGLALMLTKKKTMKDVVPFGPFLATAFFIVLWWGRDIAQFYFNFFNFI